MSQETERIPVPANGRGPKLDPAAGATGAADATEAAGDAASGAVRDDATDPSGEVSRDLTVGFTPNQLAAGFGIVAGLLILFVGARRRRGRSRDDE